MPSNLRLTYHTSSGRLPVRFDNLQKILSGNGVAKLALVLP